MADRAASARNPVETRATRAVRRTVIIIIDLYRAILSPLLTAAMGPSCRFEPTCSAYARDAIARHGVVAGARMTLGRLARCRPAGGWGPDPVPHEHLGRTTFAHDFPGSKPGRN
jgi:putative membrane protein insertion efficiency factor